MDLKQFAKDLGLELEIIPLMEGNECSVTGATEKVIAFRDETNTYGINFYEIDEKTSCYIFID